MLKINSPHPGIYVPLLFIIPMIVLLSNEKFSSSLVSYSTTLSIRSTSDPLTTIVIAYFPFKRSKHSETHYQIWFRNFLGYCQSPMIIFTSVEYQPVLNRLRLNGSLPSYFIVDYSTPLQIPPIQSLVSIFEEQHKTDPERSYHSVELYAIWCAKSFMLNRSAELNPFQSKYFLYVDAGAFRSTNYQFRQWPDKEIIERVFSNDRFLLSMISSFPRQFCTVNYTITNDPIKIDLIEGGIFGGSARAIHWWTSLYYETINLYISKNFFIGKDQHIMNAIALTYRNQLNVMLSFRSSCGNQWFAFGPLLANKTETKMLSFSPSCQQQNISSIIIPLETICNDSNNLT